MSLQHTTGHDYHMGFDYRKRSWSLSSFASYGSLAVTLAISRFILKTKLAVVADLVKDFRVSRFCPDPHLLSTVYSLTIIYSALALFFFTYYSSYSVSILWGLQAQNCINSSLLSSAVQTSMSQAGQLNKPLYYLFFAKADKQGKVMEAGHRTGIYRMNFVSNSY